MPDSPLLLNFTLLECGYIDVIASNDQHYHLRDDVPASRLLGMFRLPELDQALQASVGPDEAEAALHALEDRTFELGAICFRHTLPDAGDPAPHPAMQAELRAVFTVEQMGVIVAAFFTRRFRASRTPSDATPASLPTPTSLTDHALRTSLKPNSTSKSGSKAKTAAKTTGNRAARRA
jgi:hypothetical protein